MDRFKEKFTKKYLIFLEEEINIEFEKDNQNGSDMINNVMKEFITSIHKFEYSIDELKIISEMLFNILKKY